jgi:hypothetical protein
MMFLENKHRPQPDSPLATSSNINTDLLSQLEDLLASRRIPCQKGPLPLSSQIQNLLWVCLCQLLNTSVKVVANLSRILHEVETLDFLDDGTEEEGAGWVAHPSVELTVGFVGTKVVVAKIVSCCLGLLGEGYLGSIVSKTERANNYG